jgi:hypothetical protein
LTRLQMTRKSRTLAEELNDFGTKGNVEMTLGGGTLANHKH